MKEAVIYYWSDKCNRKAMAETVAKEVREAYANVQIKEVGQAKKKDVLKAIASNRSFVLIASNDFWRDGQWLRYWAERMKAYGVEVQPDGRDHL